ncbi:MAG TPA: HAMP domain-containing protein, partial [Microthrixaceae bacterium]|nr:HAMP domain-containing protein [Microthrixaceae bacterium]
MLARLNVRTRLFVILVPALIGLGAFAGLGIQSRIDARDDAARGLSVSRTALAASRFAGAVRTERMLTVAATVGGASSKTSAGVDEQVARTDVAAHLLEITLGELKAQDWPAANAPTASATADQLRSQINALATIRELDLSVPANARSVADAYSGVLATVADTSRAMLSGLPGATTAQSSTHWLQDGIDRESRGAAMALVAAGGDASAAQETADVLAEAGVAFDVFRRETTDAGRDALTLASAQPPVRNSDATLARLGTADQVAGADLVADRWAVEANARMTALAGVGEKLLGDEVDARAASFADAKRTMIWFAVGAFATFIIAALTALVISRTITTSLRRLGRAAREIADEQLPALVESLRGADGPPPALGFTEIDVDDHHELGAVAEALNGLARTASDVAAQQHATLRKGISDIFVNLARRNQTLLDRQIEFIDRLEANEEDPDQLENLFRLDHLATRMRRNAESLLVLAGAEAPRRRARDVALTDVIRVAVGEVEDFARIAFGEVEPVQTLGAAAVDIAHLLSELMENGTQYSPPDREVEVLGHREVDGGYRIRVIDQGVGMTDGQLDSANALLAKPPAIGLSISRSLGFVVVATLAARHGISVTIARNASGGITADVGIPRILITSADEATDAAAVGAPAKPAGANGAQPTTTPTAPTGVTHQPLAARPQPSHEPMSAPAL